ncbi:MULTISPECIES: transglycosylase/D,D-transpeptidase PonA2 [Mycolicibacterium]|uniref:Penicillin-binding protein n=1 Tax=Mycolicibacterium wolinskyi TaxID=59750 RepID=A0A132PLQ4_9MYCO|nr:MULTISPECIES: transglycosylase/D,D-transpeptidase PonA2 [Mycolicibacterium]KWX23278.1 penicillin-binding protein [Mycolicibacterium wolinskyi]MCV7284809.1 transglycosylase/D,D-transpeptidase PonA2 [Mycolicibacterium wolinskyi]MCV7295371.1 transglycosylase/D,D-transpeptidase PonA2 [Mycolicibacterium goodii]ORX17910.1 penicillin-binding protein [Mycolicibacterium wolinskyi]
MPEPPTRPPTAVTVIKLAWCCLLASVLAATLMFPVVGGFGLMSNRASDVVANGSAALVEGEVPQVSTMVDAKGNTIAWLYSQRRFEVPSEQIANTMKLAIVSIEDKRFAEHNGVDWQGTLTGLAGYMRGDLDTRGGSTLEQQYVKNYQLLVIAQTDAERRAAIETTPARKLREIRMALTLDKTFTKPEILTRYLNLVSFGNGSYGIQDAAQTYFGVNASELNWQQAALLAGMVQSTSALNPYTNPDGALARRNLVLDTMIENIPQEAEALRAAKEQPLGILPQPNELPRGCIAAGDRAFFCDYALEYLARAGISKEQVAKGGYLIRTTLDPDVQATVKSAINQYAPADIDGIASVMSVVKPGKDSHPVLAMASNRTYGLNTDAGETMQPQPFSLAGNGAGSVFKIFTVAAAMEMGMGINTQLSVPAQFQAKGLGSSDRPGCPAATWCVSNAGGYRGSMNVTDALATSPNTAFAKLISQVGVQRAVDMAVRLGLRSYALPGTARDYDPESNESLADFVKRQNIGSFTLGPIEVNALELSNVAATLASGGTWCPPSPIAQVVDRNGNDVSVTTETCEQAVPEGLANTLANALSKDDQSPGTAAAAAGSVGWDLPMSGKTGTTESNRSSAFLGFTNQYAAANYIYDDSTEPSELCSFPLRQCGSGGLFGGNEPARTWFAAMKPIANSFGPVALPPTDPRYVDGGPGSQVPSVSGLDENAARQRLRDAGFQVADQAAMVNSSSRYGTVVGTNPSGQTIPGSIVTIQLSNGIAPPPPPPPVGFPGGPPPEIGQTVVNIPGLPPITVPVLGPPPPAPPPPP